MNTHMLNEQKTGKIGVFSMAPGKNYGNRLQNFAVQLFLEEQGYEAITMRYDRSVFIGKRTQKFNLFLKIHHAWRGLLTNLHSLPGCRHDGDSKKIKDKKGWATQYKSLEDKRGQAYRSFDERMMNFADFSITRDNQEFERLRDFDCFVCGSDQIWNPNFDLQEVYFLTAVPREKRVALSPSIGADQLSATEKEEMVKLINDIPYLSVREQRGAELIYEMTGRDAVVLQDPTVWIRAKTWREFAQEPAYKPEKAYILCYFLGNRTKEYTRRIQKIAQENDLEIINMFDVHEPQHYADDPQNFVWLIDHAALVCTDSFHGVAFSIIMHTPFLAFDRVMRFPSMSSRIIGLMQCVGLDRHIDRVSQDQYLSMDCSTVDMTLENVRKRAEQYLHNAIDQIHAHAQKRLPDLAVESYCNGCRACQQACLADAIEWKKNGEGFFHPYVQEDKCIHCKKCESVCHVVHNVRSESNLYPDAVAAFVKDNDTRMQSSSGGCFTALATEILNRGGVVFGAAFDEEWHVRHKYVESEQDLGALRTSKYVQSDVGQTYVQAKDFLEQGRWVYYSGTPCQVQGLRTYLGKDYDRLILQDIICHGVPSEDVWDAYLIQQYDDKSKIKSINFRYKESGWQNYCICVETVDGRYLIDRKNDPYFNAFVGGNWSLRPSCYHCVNKTAHRSSDLTLADYWGVGNVHPEINAHAGVSLVLVQSPKGKDLLNCCAGEICMQTTDSQKALRYNSSAVESSKVYPLDRKEFYDKYQRDLIATVKELKKKPPMYPLVLRGWRLAKKVLKKG